MSDGRLVASVEAAALLRKIEARGDFAAILRKGDADRGSLLLVVRNRGRHVGCLERMLAPSGSYNWTQVGPESDHKLAEFLDSRVRFDEDLWLIELDVADPERFIAETTLSG